MGNGRVVRELPSINIYQVIEPEKKKTAVAAYARVSTEKEDQENSFERQVEHYTQMITSNPEWRMVEIYKDPGISGTRAEKRPDFMRMIDDCRAGKIEKIIVKSISRFARNTVDALNYIRELRDMRISVFFENENIDTLSPGGEVLITILAAMAEQESRTISTNIKWAWQRKFQNGEIILNTGLMLGYRRLPDKDEHGFRVYEINEEEAKIVRRIYEEFLKGVTVTRICRDLEADGIPTKTGKPNWNPSVIRSILSNEKYTGNAILGKTYKQDVLTKKRIKNDGTMSPIYYAENSHPAIIDMEMFELAKKEMENRKAAKTATVGNSRFTSKYAFSGLLVCGTCGSLLRRHSRTIGSGKYVPAWGCATRIKEGRAVCDSHHVNEDVLERTYLTAIRELTGGADDVVEMIRESTLQTMEPENSARLDAVEREIVENQEHVLAMHKNMMAGAITESEYRVAVAGAKERMEGLEARQAELRTSANRYAEARMWLEDFRSAIQGSSIDNLDPVVMKSLIEKIVVFDDHITVTFKCGASIEQKYVR